MSEAREPRIENDPVVLMRRGLVGLRRASLGRILEIRERKRAKLDLIAARPGFHGCKSGAEARARQTLRVGLTRMGGATPPFVRYGYFVV